MTEFVNDPVMIARAAANASTCFKAHSDLVRMREAKITREEAAVRIGWPIQTTKDFEAYWHEPTLAELRRYAHAVGAKITITIEDEDD